MLGFAFLVLASCLAAEASSGEKGTGCRHPSVPESAGHASSGGFQARDPLSHIWIANPISRDSDRPALASTGPVARSLQAADHGFSAQRRGQSGPQASGFVVPLTFVAHRPSVSAQASQRSSSLQHQEQRNLAEASTALHGSLVGLG